MNTARTSDSFINVHGVLALSSREHVWQDDDGVIHAIVDLGACDISFGSPGEARAVAAKIAKAADDMDALAARRLVKER